MAGGDNAQSIHPELDPPPIEALHTLTLLEDLCAALPPVDGSGDAALKRLDQVLRGMDFLQANVLSAALGLLDGDILITKVRAATSKRSMYLFKAASKNRRRSGTTPATTEPQQHQPYYTCIFPESNPVSSDDHSFYYCSCRSYFDKMIKSPGHAETPLCKHLLALMLLPYLPRDRPVVSELELSSDVEFAKLILDRTMPE